MIYLKLTLILLFIPGCSLFSPKVEVIKSKDIKKYKTIGSTNKDCLNMNSSACELFLLVNAFRSQKNLPPFVAIENCITSAQSHTNKMHSQERLKHNLKNDKWSDRIRVHGAVGELMAENIALATTPKDVLKRWKNSKYHYNNLINEKFSHSGIGQKGRYWTQCFLKTFNQ